jgi:RimJ/RimL family protein N-acetyltransferase
MVGAGDPPEGVVLAAPLGSCQNRDMTSTPDAPLPLFTTDRVVVAPLTLADDEFIVALLTDPDWLRYIGDRGVRTPDDARRYLETGPMASYAAHGFGLYRVSRRDTGVPIGICGLLRRATLPDVDIGFAFLPAHRGQGFAVETARATLAYARDTLGLGRIVAIVSPENAASIRVLETLGMRQEGMVQLSADAKAVCLFASPRAG